MHEAINEKLEIVVVGVLGCQGQSTHGAYGTTTLSRAAALSPWEW